MTRLAPVLAWAAALLWLAVLFVPLLDEGPQGRDEEFLATFAARQGPDCRLYRDCWELRTPLLPWTWALAARVTPEPAGALRIAVVLAHAAAAVCLVALLRRRVEHAWLAGPLYLLAAAAPRLDGTAIGPEPFQNAFLLAGWWGLERLGKAAGGAGLGLAWVTAGLAKQSGFVVGFPLAISALRGGRAWALLLGAFAALAAGCCWLLWTGAGPAFVNDALLYPLLHASAEVDGSLRVAALRDLLVIGAQAGPVLWCAIALLVRRLVAPSDAVAPFGALAIGGALAALAAARGFAHYWLPLVPPGVAGALAFAPLVAKRFPRRAAVATRVWLVGLGLLQVVCSMAFLPSAREATRWFRERAAQADVVARSIRELSAPGGTLLVWSPDVDLYRRSGLRPATRYWLLRPVIGPNLSRVTPVPDARAHAAFRSELEAAPASVIAVQARLPNYDLELPRNQWLRDRLAADYEEMSEVRGVRLFRLRTRSAPDASHP